MAGAFALSTAFAAMHPVDTLKTRMQAHARSASAPDGTKQLGLKSLFCSQTLRQLTKGFTASVLGAGSFDAI